MSENLICVCFLLFIPLLHIPFFFLPLDKTTQLGQRPFLLLHMYIWTVDRYQTKSMFALFPYAMILFCLCGKMTSDNSQIKDEAEQNGREMDGQRGERQQVCVSPEERERLWQSEDTESSRVRKRKTGQELQLPLKLQLTQQQQQQQRQCQDISSYNRRFVRSDRISFRERSLVWWEVQLCSKVCDGS